MLADARSGKYQKPSINPIGFSWGLSLEFKLVLLLAISAHPRMCDVGSSKSIAGNSIDRQLDSRRRVTRKANYQHNHGAKRKGEDADVASAGTQVADSLKSASTAEWQQLRFLLLGQSSRTSMAELLACSCWLRFSQFIGAQVFSPIPGALIAFAGGKLGIQNSRCWESRRFLC